jgi:hypothetical protein
LHQHCSVKHSSFAALLQQFGLAQHLTEMRTSLGPHTFLNQGDHQSFSLTGAMISRCTHPAHRSLSQQSCQSSRRRCQRGLQCLVRTRIHTYSI